MPMYDFFCEICGIIETEKHMADPNPRECLVCGGPIRRHFAPQNVVLRGAGFFTTDNRLDNYGEPDIYDKAVMNKEFD